MHQASYTFRVRAAGRAALGAKACVGTARGHRATAWVFRVEIILKFRTKSRAHFISKLLIFFISLKEAPQLL